MKIIRIVFEQFTENLGETVEAIHEAMVILSNLYTIGNVFSLLFSSAVM